MSEEKGQYLPYSNNCEAHFWGALGQSHKSPRLYLVMLGPKGTSKEKNVTDCVKSMHMYRKPFTPPATETLHGTVKVEGVNREFFTRYTARGFVTITRTQTTVLETFLNFVMAWT